MPQFLKSDLPYIGLEMGEQRFAMIIKVLRDKKEFQRKMQCFILIFILKADKINLCSLHRICLFFFVSFFYEALPE